jgi:hypothetical protein
VLALPETTVTLIRIAMILFDDQPTRSQNVTFPDRLSVEAINAYLAQHNLRANNVGPKVRKRSARSTGRGPSLSENKKCHCDLTLHYNFWRTDTTFKSLYARLSAIIFSCAGLL